MKALTASALLLALSEVTLAKPNPIEQTHRTLVNADIDIVSAGTVRERDYFEVLQAPFNAGASPCRLEPLLFHTTHLVRSCP